MRVKKIITLGLTTALLAGILAGCGKNDKSTGSSASTQAIEITNVSYDPTREFYEAYNKEFADYWKEKTGQEVTVTQSHGGSGKQARSVIEGNEADIVTLALGYDITAIADAGMIDEGWQSEFENNSSPYTSTIVFLVRKGNPKHIKDWDDLVREDIGIITPNPKTSGGARWNYLAAWAYADKAYNHDETQIKEYIKKLYQNVLVLDSGARGATTTFVENGQGDVLLAWENEAYLSMKENLDDYEIITPSISILAEPPVAIIDQVVEDRGTREVATAYLDYLYSDIGQRLVGENYYRPSNKKILAAFDDVFNTDVELVTIDDDLFGGWNKAQEEHFNDGGIFDQIYTGE
ncbi:MAG: sulfate ABC transporter substrate-binding protein [Herbinix sp.]|nr:sulfate ABC transporter substrate-binding protein [Herbinix sp.]